MNYNVQIKIQNDVNLKKYLRQNSIWYKYLNRHPEDIEKMLNQMKETYNLRVSDKINNVMDSIDFLNKFIKEIK